MMLRTDQPPTIRLEDYTPPPYRIPETHLEFFLDPKETRVVSTLEVERAPNTPSETPLVLDGERITLLNVSIDGVPLTEGSYSVSTSHLTINNLPDRFTLRIETTCDPSANTTLEGLYVSSGKFCTQCEAEGFRRITYYLDRPDVMSVFSVIIHADNQSYPVLLSNGNETDSGTGDDGSHWVRFYDPHAKPCYLFALVAGDLGHLADNFVTASGQSVDLHIFVEHGKEEKASYAMDALKRSMRWDEEVFGLEYDLDVFNIVAVSDFNFGAMENKSLNIFNDRYILADPDTATDLDYENIEGIVAHEYFHNWTGNRVTCRDWFQLSLKEGLTVFRDQEFSSDMRSRPVKRIEEVNGLRSVQFREDAGPMAHPVRPDSYIEINNFYTATVYNKGAEVIRMMHTLLGAADFRKGIDLYFERHDGQAVTCDDFAAAMADASGVDLNAFKRWYSQAGTPTVTVSRSWNADTERLTVAFAQTRPDTPGQSDKPPQVIPLKLGVLSSDGEAVEFSTDTELRGDVLMLETDKIEVDLHVPGAGSNQPVLSLNRGFSAPVRLATDLTPIEKATLMASDPDPFCRWDAAQDLACNVILSGVTGETAPKQRSAFVDAFLRVAEDPQIDDAFKAKLLTLPNEAYLSDQMNVIDVNGIFNERQALKKELAQNCSAQFHELYRASRDIGSYAPDAESTGRRALRNIALTYISALESDDSRRTVVEHFTQANNMTDRSHALMLLTDMSGPERTEALSRFYEDYKDDHLVMDKWFTIQALSRRTEALAEVKALMDHPSFSMTNPNKVRALIGAFTSANPTGFHHASGAGYSFLADQVIALNAINPQTAARLVAPFGRWRRFDGQRQNLMKAELERIQKAPDLATDLVEVISKFLAN